MNKVERVALLVTAGNGPAECHQAVGHLLERMKDEAERLDLPLLVHGAEGSHGPRSAVVVAEGAGAESFAASWCGTILWRMQSPLRKHHKRGNWFVGVFRLKPGPAGAPVIRKADVVFSTLRAGGPGGQHQNTTDSAVRAVHPASGLSVVVRDGRSQHRNKALALERLQALAEARAQADAAGEKSGRHAAHQSLERGNPVRVFKGGRFEEVPV